MKIMDNTTELQIRLRPDEVNSFVNFVLTAPASRFRKEMIELMKMECLL